MRLDPQPLGSRLKSSATNSFTQYRRPGIAGRYRLRTAFFNGFLPSLLEEGNMMTRILSALILVTTAALTACAETPSTPTSTPRLNSADESTIRAMVDAFGRRLQNVSLLAPDAAEQIRLQYLQYVSPALLASWMSDPRKAPGRLVSSPWPDHIEIYSLAMETPDRCVITGSVIELTSVEAVNGGAAAKIPVRIVAQELQGSWLITDYAPQP